jgi:hypothetical protein
MLHCHAHQTVRLLLTHDTSDAMCRQKPFREERDRHCSGGTPGPRAASLPTGATYAEDLPPRNWLELRGYALGGQVTLSTLEAVVSDAAAHSGRLDPDRDPARVLRYTEPG